MRNSDYYPTDLNSLDFVKVMKPFHDLYTNDRIKFAIGETGLGIDAPIQDRLNWLEIISSPATMQALPNFISLSWVSPRLYCSKFGLDVRKN